MNEQETRKAVADAERYGTELDCIAALLQAVHPIGQVKGIGRLEALAALGDVLADRAAFRQLLVDAEGLLLRSISDACEWLDADDLAEAEALCGRINATVAASMGQGPTGLPLTEASNPEPAPTGDVMPRVDGKPFRCECGCNVFRWVDTERGRRLRCNSCRALYEAE